MNKNRIAVTASDVARSAQVSRSAVSRAFTPGASISRERRHHILQVANQLGYRPNALARSLVNSKKGRHSGLVAVVMGEFDNPFQPYFFAQLTQALQAEGRVPMLIMPDQNGQLDDALDRLIAYQVDAAIIAAGSLSPEATEAFLALHIPTVLLGREARQTPVPAILTDNRAVGRLAADYLIQQGCQTPAYIAGRKDGQASQERQQGFLAALDKASITPAAVLDNTDYSHDAGFASAQTLLQCHPGVDGVFCACDALAMGALAAFRLAGIAVPESVRLIGCDNVPQAESAGVQLTTIAQPVEALVATALQALNQSIRGEAVAACQRLAPAFVQRDT